MNDTQRDALLQDADFVALSRRKNSIAALLTLLTVAVYYGFIALLVFGKGWLGQKVAGGVTLGVPIGIGVIVLSWLFTGIYVRWANSEYDAMVARVRAKISDAETSNETVNE